MITICDKCAASFDDEFRLYTCPHAAFPANDGNNNFMVHAHAHLFHPKEQSIWQQAMALGTIYDADYFLRGKQTGKSLYENYHWMPELTVPMVDHICQHLGANHARGDTILDFGCARGYLVRALREMGYVAWGYDISQWARENCDPAVKEYIVANESALFEFDWTIAKDVLEHVQNVGRTVYELMKGSRKGVFAVVPLAERVEYGSRWYDVPEYEADVTHIHRRPLQWWAGLFMQPGWSVDARYRLPGVKDNYAQYPTGNGFITARRIEG